MCRTTPQGSSKTVCHHLNIGEGVCLVEEDGHSQILLPKRLDNVKKKKDGKKGYVWLLVVLSC